MALENPGVRVEKVATKAVYDGRPTVEENVVGWANRTLQLGAYVDPNDEEATKQIKKEEAFVIMVGGEHELPVGAEADEAPEAVKAGDLLWINPADNSIKTVAAEGETKFLPLGVVTSVDATAKTCLINTNDRSPFLGI